MPSEWKSATLNDVAIIRTGKLDSNHATEGGQYPFFTCAPKPLKIGSFSFDDNAIILAGNNANGIFHLNRYSGKFNAYQRTYVLTAREGALIDVDYLFYSLRTLLQRLGEYSQGTATKFLTKTILTSLSISLPSLSEQKAVGTLLRSLDDSISLVEKKNQSLASIAHAIFKSWFVDFDPVRAKAEGREPDGMDAATAALFPESFSENEHALIPDGWGYAKAGTLMFQSRDSMNPSRHPQELFAHFSLPAFDEGKRPKIEAGSDIKSNKTVVRPNAVLLSKLNPHTPRIWLPDLSEGFRAICSTEFMVMVPNMPLSAEYLFCQFSDANFATVYGGLTTGTSNSHQRVKAGYLMEQMFVKPDRGVVEAFTASARPLFDRMKANIRMQRTLAELRDTLLPRVISGKLRVPEAEKLVEGVL